MEVLYVLSFQNIQTSESQFQVIIGWILVFEQPVLLKG